MKRFVKRILLVLVVGATAAYWIGADVCGLWLPVKLPWKTYQQEYAPPSVTLEDATGEQAARELLAAWLECYRSGQTDPFVRIREYAIDSVQQVGQTGHGFVCLARFRLQPYGRMPREVGPGTTLAEIKTAWISGNGIVEDGWIVDKEFYLLIERTGDSYSIVDLGTAPPSLANPM
jgi:hypothetical protein